MSRAKERGRREPGEEEHEIALVCNPLAGGRWKELAGILDSKEARRVRRIVTDSIEDIGPALAGLWDTAQLILVYGGDGTIQHLLDAMLLERHGVAPQLGFIGGGTMNVTTSWCGFSGDPAKNFRQIVRAYLSGELLLKEVPLLRVSHGDRAHLGFTFGMGAPIRILDTYEQGRKTKLNALKLAVGSISAIWTRFPSGLGPLLREQIAEVVVDGKAVPYDTFAVIFCNVTGRLNPGVEPFVKQRTRDTFHLVAYAVTPREASLLMPFLARGYRPIDPKSLLKPIAAWRQALMSLQAEGSLPSDPRYINDVARVVEVRTDESLYTVDGELFHAEGEPLRIELGPTLRLAVSPNVGLRPTLRLAAGVAENAHRGLVPKIRA